MSFHAHPMYFYVIIEFLCTASFFTHKIMITIYFTNNMGVYQRFLCYFGDLSASSCLFGVFLCNLFFMVVHALQSFLSCILAIIYMFIRVVLHYFDDSNVFLCLSDEFSCN